MENSDFLSCVFVKTWQFPFHVFSIKSRGAIKMNIAIMAYATPHKIIYALLMTVEIEVCALKSYSDFFPIHLFKLIFAFRVVNSNEICNCIRRMGSNPLRPLVVVTKTKSVVSIMSISEWTLEIRYNYGKLSSNCFDVADSLDIVFIHIKFMINWKMFFSKEFWISLQIDFITVNKQLTESIYPEFLIRIPF